METEVMAWTDEGVTSNGFAVGHGSTFRNQG